MAITERPLFWGILSITSISCLIFAFKFFSCAYPIVHLDITADRQDVITKARELAHTFGWGPENFHTAASFETDDTVKTYVELEAGGASAFAKMLEEKLYVPYTWQVRHFKPLEVNETTMRFTPQGVPYGFIETIAESTSGAALSPEKARLLAEKSATTNWHVDLSAFALLETAEQNHPNGRTDHTFTYERKNVYMGKSLYRLKLVVRGDKLTELTHFMFIPENFTLRFREMRSANNTIAAGATILMALLYLFGGCIGGLIYLMRKKFIVWRLPLIWAFCIALGNMLITVNQLPLLWMGYDTALSSSSFFIQLCTSTLLTFVTSFALYGVIFIVAEGLTRAAFGSHIQFWHLWQRRLASSYMILGFTLGGYLVVGIWLAFLVAFYALTTASLGWWQPSDALFNPNILATYVPWIAPVCTSLYAGFVEECLFRAVPLSCAALLGKRFGNPRLWIFSAFILQAVIFGAGHANYPTFPAYARLVELILPSFISGSMYLVFGLLPSIIAHYSYDLVLMSIPIFVSTAHGAFINKIMIIVCGLLPILILFIARARTGTWHKTVPAEAYNSNWQPAFEHQEATIKPYAKQMHTFSSRTRYGFLITAIAALITWNFFTPMEDNARPLLITRQEAKEKLKEYLAFRNLPLKNPCEIQAFVRSSPDFNIFWHLQHRFIWQKDKALYAQCMDAHYLYAPYWRVYCVRFTGTIEERAESFGIVLDSQSVFRTRHELPEVTPGKTLSIDDARTIALDEIIKKYALEKNKLTEICAQASKKPARTDWFFTFNNTAFVIPNGGQARIDVAVAGDEIVDTTRYIFVPEEWQRNEQSSIALLKTISTICLFVLVLFAGLGVLCIHREHRTHLTQGSLWFFLLIPCIVLIRDFNTLPLYVAQFNTVEPWLNQFLTTIGSMFIHWLILAGMLLYFAMLALAGYQKRSVHKNIFNWLLGLCVGVCITAAHTLISSFLPKTEPLWAEYESLNAAWPLLATVLSALVQYTLYALIFYFIFIGIDTCVRRHAWMRVFFLITGIGVTSLSITATTLTGWLLLGIALGCILCLGYELLFKRDISLVCVAVAAYECLQHLQQGAFSAYPTAGIGAILSIIGILILSWYFFREIGSRSETL